MTQTGYMHLGQPRPTHPELENFLNAGLPPIYAGFGSMSTKDQKRTSKTVVKAARLAGQRLVLSKCWDGPPDYCDSEDIFTIKQYPHLDLFPRMAAVIHHGGAGTTATAAISGVPQIAVPYMLDQFYWGYKIRKASLGPKPVLKIFLTARKLAQAIRNAVSDEKIRSTAKLAGRRIRQKEGIEMTIDALFETLQNK